jgi:hypothetical protein
MKKVKARLEKKRDLDGIDRSNIVEAPRRNRRAANDWFTPRPSRYAVDADQGKEAPLNSKMFWLFNSIFTVTL